MLDRLVDVAAQDASGAIPAVRGAVDDSGLGRRVGDKGQQGQASGRRFRDDIERRGALGLVQRDRKAAVAVLIADFPVLGRAAALDGRIGLSAA